jgi:hexosaminidase
LYFTFRYYHDRFQRQCFHIGGDEADLALADQNVDFKAAMKKYGLPNQHELYRQFVCQMNEVVKKHGKQMIVWEGFGRHGKVPIPKDILVMAYEIRFYMPQDLVNDGYKVVNASWTPLYVVNANCRPPAEIYAWNLFQFKPFGAKAEDKGRLLAPSENVIGAQLCAWEQPQSLELPNERKRLPAMIERIWNPATGRSFDDFQRRLVATDRLLDLLLHPGPAGRRP